MTSPSTKPMAISVQPITASASLNVLFLAFFICSLHNHCPLLCQSPTPTGPFIYQLSSGIDPLVLLWSRIPTGYPQINHRFPTLLCQLIYVSEPVRYLVCLFILCIHLRTNPPAHKKHLEPMAIICMSATKKEKLAPELTSPERPLSSALGPHFSPSSRSVLFTGN